MKTKNYHECRIEMCERHRFYFLSLSRQTFDLAFLHSYTLITRTYGPIERVGEIETFRKRRHRRRRRFVYIGKQWSLIKSAVLSLAERGNVDCELPKRKCVRIIRGNGTALTESLHFPISRDVDIIQVFILLRFFALQSLIFLFATLIMLYILYVANNLYGFIANL